MSSRYDPFKEMDRLFDQTRRAMLGADTPDFDGPAGSQSMLPAGDANVGLDATDDGYVVTADLPGFEKTDLDLVFEDGVLSIRGEVDVTEEDEAAGTWQRGHHAVREQVAIPATVREDGIEATYRNGVLEVRLPTEDDVADDIHRIDID